MLSYIKRKKYKVLALGGNLDNPPAKKKVESFVTSDIDEYNKRLQAYNDSAYLHNTANKVENYINSINGKTIPSTNIEPYYYKLGDLNTKLKNYANKANISNKGKGYGLTFAKDYDNNSIQVNKMSIDDYYNKDLERYNLSFPIYENPKQKVVYQKSKSVAQGQPLQKSQPIQQPIVPAKQETPQEPDEYLVKDKNYKGQGHSESYSYYKKGYGKQSMSSFQAKELIKKGIKVMESGGTLTNQNIMKIKRKHKIRKLTAGGVYNTLPDELNNNQELVEIGTSENTNVSSDGSGIKKSGGSTSGLISTALSLLDTGVNTIQTSQDAKIKYDEYGQPLNKDDYIKSRQVQGAVNNLSINDIASNWGGLISNIGSGDWKEAGRSALDVIGAGALAERGRAKDEYKKLSDEAIEQKRIIARNKYDRDKAIMMNEKAGGTMVMEAGGRLKNNKLQGGELIPIGEGEFEAKGRTHNQGGIKLNNNTEIEDGEIIDGNKVYSEKLGIADKAKPLIARKAILEKKMKSVPAGMQNTYKKEISNIENQLRQLYGQQEQYKKDNNIQTGDELEYGGDRNKQKRGYSTLKDQLDNDEELFEMGKYTLEENLYYDEFKQKYPNLNTSKEDLYKTVKANSGDYYNPKDLLKYIPTEDGSIIRYGKKQYLKEIDQINQNNQAHSNAHNQPQSNIQGVKKDYKTGEWTVDEINKNNSSSTSTNKKNLNVNTDTLSSIADYAVPILNNVSQNAYNKKLKNIAYPSPELEKYTPLKTNVDISQSFDEINKSNANVQNLIKNNTVNSNAALSRINASETASGMMKSELMQNKNNIETDLQNKNIMLFNTIESRNNNLINKDKLSRYNKRVLTEIVNPSENAKNLAEDVSWGIERRDMKNYQKQQQDLINQVNSDVVTYDYVKNNFDKLKAENSPNTWKLIRESILAKDIKYKTKYVDEFDKLMKEKGIVL